MSVDPVKYANEHDLVCGSRLSIRPARPADGAVAVAYAKAMFAEAACWVGTEPEEFTYTAEEESRLFAECDWRLGQQFWLAVAGDQVVGMCSVGVSTRKKRRHVGTLGMSVAASHRGQGIAQALMETCLAYSRALPALLKIELCVFPDNMPALKLYQGIGFAEEGCQLRGSRRADGSFVDNVLMGLWLEDEPNGKGGSG